MQALFFLLQFRVIVQTKKRLFKITGLFCRSIGVTPTKPHGDRKCSLSNKLPSQTRITGFWDTTNRKSASIIHMDGRLFKPCHFGRAFFILQFRVIVQTDHQPTAPCGCIACTITLNHPVFPSELPTVLLVSIPMPLFASVDRFLHAGRELGHWHRIVDSRGIYAKKRLFWNYSKIV